MKWYDVCDLRCLSSAPLCTL
uniref:Uncharacterized protein n=1 Tax=Arundo donax TaxID=35708 RepID=A0A0A9FDU2_ARUDO